MQLGKLHLVPNVLAENAIYSIPAYLKPIVTGIKIWYVEEIRSARRFLKAMNKEIIIDDLTFYILNEHEQESLQYAKKLFLEGHDIGMISESGCPSVADPGNELVKIAHEVKTIVKPHIGPNSILLALMASGFNGQHFEFHGYLPNKQPNLSQKIIELENDSKLRNVSHFFIETPYRNDQMIKELIKHCHEQTRLCVAANLTAETEKILSMSIKEWKQQSESFHKQPAIFGMYSY